MAPEVISRLPYGPEVSQIYFSLGKSLIITLYFYIVGFWRSLNVLRGFFFVGWYLVIGYYGDRDDWWRTALFQWASPTGNEENSGHATTKAEESQTSQYSVMIMRYLLFAKYDFTVWNFVGREEKLMNIKQLLFLIPIHRTIPYNFLFMLQVSPRLQGFLDMMLVREPSQRAKAFELLQHAFLRGADKPSCLIPLMRSFRHSPCWVPRPCA